MKKRNLLAKALSVLLIAGLTAGCGNSCGNPGNTAAGTTDVTAAEEKTTETPAEITAEATTEALSQGELLAQEYTGFVEHPMDLNGRTIHVVSTTAGRYTYAEEKDNTSNETLEIIEAIKTIEKDYNCTITFEQLKGKDMVTALMTSKAAGETYCDILEFGCSDTYLEQIYGNNLVMPLEDAAVADIIGLGSNPWLKQSEFGDLFGHHYGVHFKTNNSGDLLRGVLIFNKDLAEQYNLGDFYDMVKKGDFTFDKFKEICASVATQSDGSVYPAAYSQEGLYVPMLVYANGGTVAENTPDGYVFTGLSDKTLEAVNYAVELVQKGYIHPSSEDRNNIEAAFGAGEAVFFFGNYASLKKFTSGTIQTEDSFGLLPAPLGPGGDSYNAVSYTDALFHVMNNVEKPEEVASVLVAIANRTGKHDMIETELMYTLQDEESAEMLKFMYDNVVCDFSRSISTARGKISGINKSILKLEKTPKEGYEEVEKEMQAAFEAVILQE